MADCRVEDRSRDACYFVITPQVVWAKCQDPYDLALWTVVKMVAGDEGECYLSTEGLAALAMMSVGKASQSRQRLIEAGLLRGQIRKDPGCHQAVWHLAVPDLWAENLAWRDAHHRLQERVEYKRSQADKAGPSPAPETGMVKLRYSHDPEKHQPFQRWVTKTCAKCGTEYECPNTWRQTQVCPLCAAATDGYVAQARAITRVLLDQRGRPTACERCGKESGDLEPHHRIPLSQGGGPGLDNVEVLCSTCRACAVPLADPVHGMKGDQGTGRLHQVNPRPTPGEAKNNQAEEEPKEEPFSPAPAAQDESEALDADDPAPSPIETALARARKRETRQREAYRAIARQQDGDDGARGWQLPDGDLQVQFLEACKAIRFEQGQKRRVRQIEGLIRTAALMGDQAWSALEAYLEAVQGQALDPALLPCLPRLWWDTRLEQARQYGWSRATLLRSLLARDKLVEFVRRYRRQKGDSAYDHGRSETAVAAGDGWDSEPLPTDL